MAKRHQKNRRGSSHTAHTNLPELITVTFAENMEQAREYETLLEANGIPSTIKEQGGESADTDGIAVMVPEDCLDEAHVVIESQDAYDDFYDFAMEDHDEEDENEYEDDILDDNF